MSAFSVIVVALIHFGFMYAEVAEWHQVTARLMPELSPEEVAKTSVLGLNQGLYNGLFGACLLGTFFLAGETRIGAQAFLLACVIVAGVVGGLTLGSWLLAGVQAGVALLALAFVVGDRA